VYGGPMFFEMSDAAAVLGGFQEVLRDAPLELGGFPGFQIAPPLPFIPEDRHGDNFVIVVGCWSGSTDRGEQEIARLRNLAPVVAEMVGPMPYPALNSAFDDLYPPGLQHYWKANFIEELTDEAIQTHIEHASQLPAVTSTVHFYPIDGACHQVQPGANAFAYRDATFANVIAGMWPDPAENEANIAWVRDYYDAVAPMSEPGGYINFMADDDQGRIADNYKQNYERLVEIKRKYDPGNLFHLNQNIAP
jgi:FAD/FMN-containing dehydrogenase